MEKQRGFTGKPIRLLCFFVTIVFATVLLAFFFSWVVKTIPSGHLGTEDFGFNTTSLTARSLEKSNCSSGEYMMATSLLIGANYGKDKNSSEFPHVERGESKDGQLNADSTLSSSGKNLSVVTSVDASNSSSSSQSEELGHAISIGDGLDTSNFMGKGSLDLDNAVEMGDSITWKDDRASNVSLERHQISIGDEVENTSVDCDITEGTWVVDESYPSYTNATCPFIDEGFNCEGNGRVDKDYMKWKWQPKDCNIHRFNATRMLELIRGKRLVFVGDSLNRNQWESMLCLLMGAVKDPKKVYETRRRKITKERGNYCFMFEEYKCTVEFYVSHFLVHESKTRIGKKRKQTLRIDTIDKGSSRWRGADILVFNTAHWWSHHKTKSGLNYYQEGNKVHPQLDVTKAFQKALLTWASWVDESINPSKTQIFFRSSAPSHFRGGLWDTGGHCREALRPIYDALISNYPEKTLIIEEIITQMKTPVTLLNITRLSDYRPDAHPSVYGRSLGGLRKMQVLRIAATDAFLVFRTLGTNYCTFTCNQGQRTIW